MQLNQIFHLLHLLFIKKHYDLFKLPYHCNFVYNRRIKDSGTFAHETEPLKVRIKLSK